jgi:serine/threonine-protein kinase
VYEVEHARLAGRYALKVLRRERAGDPEAVDRFRREAEVASGLRHPHIVQVIDFDVRSDGAPFLVMERLEGEDLKEHLRRVGPLPLARVASLCEQIASALEAAHERGVVHRDLKPENVFLAAVRGARGDFAKVLDFGISKVRAASTRLTGDRTILGTPHYMAPEQARGLDAIDGRADQFALAAIAYEMLAGTEAFQGEDATAILYQVVHETPPRLAGATALASPAVDAVLRRGLAKDPAARFPNVTAFASALSEASQITEPSQQPGAVSATSAPPSPTTWRAGAWVVGAILVAAAVWLAGRWVRATRQPATPNAAAPRLDPSPSPPGSSAPPSWLDLALSEAQNANPPPKADAPSIQASPPADRAPRPGRAGKPPRRQGERIRPYNDL